MTTHDEFPVVDVPFEVRDGYDTQIIALTDVVLDPGRVVLLSRSAWGV